MARNSASSAASLSFTPRSSTDCPSTGIACACTRRMAARASGVNLAGMVGMHHQPHGLVRRHRGRQCSASASPDRRPAGGYGCEWSRYAEWPKAAATISPSRRGDSISGSPPVRITSPISGRARSQSIGGLQLRIAQQPAIRAHMLAAEAEPAIDRADQQRLQQRPVGIAMHDALDRRKRVIADRVRPLMRPPSPIRRGPARIAARSGRQARRSARAWQG